MVPTKKQWKSWSLPSQLTAVGALIGLLGIAMSLLLFLLGSSNAVMLTDESVKRLVEAVYQRKLENSAWQSDQHTLVEQQYLKAELSGLVHFIAGKKSSQQEIDSLFENLGKGQSEEVELILRESISKNKASAAEAYRHIGTIYYFTDIKNAITAYKESTELDPVNAYSWNQIGHLNRRLGMYEEAKMAYKKVLSIGEVLEDNSLIGTALNNLGIIQKILGNLGKAEEYYLEALRINRLLNDEHSVAHQYGNLGIVYKKRNEFNKAEKYFLKALDICIELNQLECEARAYNDLGSVLSERNRFNEAEEYYLKSVGLYESLDIQEGLAKSYGNLGYNYEKLHNYEKNVFFLLKSLKIHRSLEDKEGMAKNLTNLGKVYYQTDVSLSRAENSFIEALTIYKSIDDKEGVAKLYSNLGLVYQAQGSIAKAKEVWTKSFQIFKKLGNEPNFKKVKGLLDSLESKASG